MESYEMILAKDKCKIFPTPKAKVLSNRSI